MIPIAIVNRTGLVEAEPASRNDMFISAPKKAAIPVRQPKMQAQSDGDLTEGDQPANHASWWPCSRTLMKSRYHS
jgi:hypothetical protein